MWVPGAMAATSAAMVRMKPADAARAPDGPTKTATGARDVIMRETMVARGVEQSARRPKNDDDEQCVGGIGGVDDAGEVFGRDRWMMSIKLGDDHRSSSARRLTADERDQTDHQRQDRDEAPRPRHGGLYARVTRLGRGCVDGIAARQLYLPAPRRSAQRALDFAVGGVPEGVMVQICHSPLRLL